MRVLTAGAAMRCDRWTQIGGRTADSILQWVLGLAILENEKELTRARDALAASRRRMPRLAVENEYAFDGPDGKASLLDLFQGRRQLIVDRAFFEPGVDGGPSTLAVVARWWPTRLPT